MLTLKQIQDIEADILEQIHIFCEENNIRYCLACGTLLGAVRHKGFIPWDNDIDICMPRPDYEKFIYMVRENPINSNLKLLHYTLDTKYHYLVARICDLRTVVTPSYLREIPDDLGVWVDIFAVDGMWEKPWRHPFYWMGLTFNKIMQRAETYYMPQKKGISNFIKKMLILVFPSTNNKHQFLVDQYAKKCSYEKHNKVIDITDWDRKNYKIFLTHEDFDKRVKMEFEGRKFYGPKSWDRYLKGVYGDYMNLPPEDQRKPHDFVAEWRDKNAK